MANLALRVIFGDLNSLVDQAGAQAQTVVAAGDSALAERIMQAAQAAMLVIDHGREAYKELLDYTIHQVSPEVQSFVNQLQTFVNGVLQQQDVVLQNAATTAQQLANTLPCANLHPQLTAIEPRYFLVDDAHPISLVTLRGNFAHPRGDFKPFLQFGTTAYTTQERLTQGLSFLFQNTIFGNRTDPRQFYFAKGELKVPFEKPPHFLLRWLMSPTIDWFTFHITLVALPRIAGSGVAFFSSTQQQREVLQYQQVQSCSGNGVTVTLTFLPTPGYKFVVSTAKSRWINHYNLGPIHPNFHPLSITVNIHCAAAAGRGGGPGSAILEITCDEEKFVTMQNPPRQQQFDLTWNTDRTFVPTPGESLNVIDFRDCRGRQYHFVNPTVQDNLRLQAGPNGIWQLRAERPSNLNFAFNP